MDNEFYTGGTDVMDRQRNRVLKANLTDRLGDVSSGIKGKGKSMAVAAGSRVAELADNEKIAKGYAGLSQAAGELATPQIRRQATVGGNLSQATRCLFYRHPNLKCCKKGDPTCSGRNSSNSNGVLFDLGGCPHPHPSTLGMAFLAYDATVTVNGETKMAVADLYGDGDGGTRDNLLNDDDLITEITVPAPIENERSAYMRASARAKAEWAQVEVLVRLKVEDGKIAAAAVAAGAVSQVPMRLPKVEEALIGKRAEEASLAEAAKLAADGANPFSGAEHKALMLERCVVACGTKALGLA